MNWHLPLCWWPRYTSCVAWRFCTVDGSGLNFFHRQSQKVLKLNVFSKRGWSFDVNWHRNFVRSFWTATNPVSCPHRVKKWGILLDLATSKEMCQYLPIVTHAYSLCKIVLWFETNNSPSQIDCGVPPLFWNVNRLSRTQCAHLHPTVLFVGGSPVSLGFSCSDFAPPGQRSVVGFQT